MSVTGTYKNDAMLRQITEAVQIENTATGTLLNDRAEWNMTHVPHVTISFHRVHRNPRAKLGVMGRMT